MKKILLLPLLILGVMHADDTNTTSRTQTMQNMELGMISIQKGLMYNDRGIVQKGVEEIKKNAKDIDAFDIKNEKGTNFKAKRYAETESKAISGLADDMLKGFDKGDKNRVLDIYRRMQNRCLVCHEIIRKW